LEEKFTNPFQSTLSTTKLFGF